MSLGRGAHASSPRRAVRLVANLMVAAVIAGPFASGAVAQQPTPGAAACREPGQVTQAGQWEHIKAPNFPTGPKIIEGFEATRFDPNRVYVHNGFSVMRSFDGGCHWDPAFDLDDVPSSQYPYSSNESRITDLHMSTAGITYLGIAQLGHTTRPHVVLSPDGGETWQTSSDGLESMNGVPLQIEAAPGAPNIVYMLLSLESRDESLGAGYKGPQAIAVSEDGGLTWDRGAGFANSIGVDLPVVGGVSVVGGAFTGMTIDPRTSSDVWLYGPSGLYRSTDGGQTVSLVNGISQPIGAVDIFRIQTSDPARIIATDANSRTMHVSRDGGMSFGVQMGPGVVQSIAQGPVPDFYVLGTDAGTFVTDPSGFVNITPPDRREVLDLRAVLGQTAATLYGRTDTTLERYFLVAPLPPFPDFRYPPSYIDDLPPNVVLREPGELTPDGETIVLRQGRSKTVPYHLGIPEAPTPLDLFFLVDVSGSMQPSIDGIRLALGDIITNLQSSGIDTWFGVGEYRSYTDDPAFARLLDVESPGDDLKNALNSLQARGGGQETQLAALLQLATGKGQTSGGYVPPNQDVGWRPGSVRVVLHVTDEPFSEGPPNPSYEEVSRALTGDGAKQVGLAIQTIVDSTLELGRLPSDGLERVAIGSGAEAPTPVDCDGDGAPDLDTGDPLVCRIDPARAKEASVMAPAIVNTVKAVKDVGSVDLRVKTPLGNTITSSGVVREVEPRIVYDVNFKEPQSFDFEITYTCPRLRQTKTFPVDLAATDEGRILATADAKVRCVVEDPPDDPPLPPAFFVPLAPIPPPPPRPPEVIPEPNPNPNPNPAQQAQAQGAMVTQEQEQPQLAFATSGGPEGEIVGERVEEHEMSRYRANRSEPEPFEFVYMAAAVSMAFMFGWAQVARRHRTRKEYVWR